MTTKTLIKPAGAPHSTDLHVGGRVRLRRKEMGISQTELAEAVKLTFQQIQKYERGTNRVSASKLHEIARYLNVHIGYFFEGMPDNETGEISTSEKNAGTFLKSAEGQELAAAFAILSPSKRKGVLGLVRSILADESISD